MKKLLILFLFATIALFLVQGSKVEANGIPYTTYTYSSANRRFVPTQDAYLPLSISYNLGGQSLNAAEDITIDANDNVYVADTGNKRIIRYNLQNDTVMIIGEGILDEPKGVHVGYDGHLYVADYGNNAAYQFLYDDATESYSLGVTYEKPVGTPYFTDSDPFYPFKVVTDRGNVVYVVLAGNINGLAKFENNGTFSGFFGANKIPSTFYNAIRFIVFDEQQRRNWFQMIPPAVYNVAVDENGLILTITQGQPGYLKLDIASNVYSESVWGFRNIEDAFVGPTNTIFTISRDGMITEYSPEGDTLFVFSGRDSYNQKGLFKQPKGIAVDSKNNIYAIDYETNSLQVFIPTHFANLVHEAIALYQEGRYSESLEPWQEVLRMNALFDLANQGIGDAYFAQMEYRLAMESYAVARDQTGYSNAFWEVRNVALLNSGTYIVVFLLALIFLYALNRFVPVFAYIGKPIRAGFNYLGRYKVFKEIHFGLTIFKKPVDGFYSIKREKASSNLTATILLLAFFGVYLFWIYQTSFLFNDRIASEINLMQEVITIFLPFFLWVIANYLVSSIRDGEGKLSDVYQATSYMLIPMIITLPIATIVSQGLTYNEGFIYDAILYVGLAVSLVYFIIMVKEIHYYDTKPTIANIFISVFTGLMIFVFVAIIYLLLSEVAGFFIDIYRELTSRG